MWDNVRGMGLQGYRRYRRIASHPLGEVHMNLLMLHGRDCLHGLHENSHLAGKVANNPSGKWWWLSANWWIHEMIVVNIQIVMICKIGRHLCTSLHIEIPDQHIHHNERADKHEDNDKPCVKSSAAHAQQTDRDKTLATKKRHRHKHKLILVPGFNPLKWYSNYMGSFWIISKSRGDKKSMPSPNQHRPWESSMFRGRQSSPMWQGLCLGDAVSVILNP